MKKIFTLIVMLAATLGMQAQETWVVAGSEALLGEDWNADTEINVMTSTDGGTTFTLTKEGCKLQKGFSYEYKIVKRTENSKEWYGAGENHGDPNYNVTVTENGEYKVTFTFKVAEETAEAAYVKTGEAEFEEGTWTLVGSSVLCGKSWDLEDAEGKNTFTKIDDVTYQLVKEDLVLEAGVANEYKIAYNHSWDVSYGINGTKDNNSLMVGETAKYKVTFTFVNDDTHLLTANAEKTGEAVIGEKTWTICGAAALCGVEWDPTATENDMKKTAEGEYTLVKTGVYLLTDTKYEYKVAANHAWDESYGLNGTGTNNVLELKSDDNYEDGFFDVTFIFLTDGHNLDASAETSTGIESVKVLIQKSAPIYNLQGQRVSGNYRGIAIQNGRKVVVK